jgi:hypothetical protein
METVGISPKKRIGGVVCLLTATFVGRQLANDIGIGPK